MQDITRKAVRPSDSEKHVKFRSIQEDEYNKIIKTDEGEYIQIIMCPSMGELLELQIDGLIWPDSVDHLLEKYEDGSRTEVVTGFALKVE